MSNPKRPRDPNKLAKSIVELATMDEAERSKAVGQRGKSAVTDQAKAAPPDREKRPGHKD